ncbi:MAG: hypothetical protein JWL62_2671 [Hyphomicrobiales bacterium]|nr:hypothetical protein [Hyphomicrobiales bacterium]
MLFVTIAYFLATLVVGGAKLIAGETLLGLSFLGAAVLAYWGGSAIKLAIFAPALRPRLVGLLVGACFAAVAALVTVASGVRFEAFDRDLHGSAWVLAGVVGGIFVTRRRRPA